MQINDTNQDLFVNAAFDGDLTAVRSFLDAGADINLAPRWWNALHAAIENMQVEVVQYLLEAGADPDMLCGGIRPLHHAIDVEADTAAQTGEQLAFVLTPLLIEAGADVNGVDESGRTPLQWALDWGHQSGIELLRSRGAGTFRG